MLGGGLTAFSIAAVRDFVALQDAPEFSGRTEKGRSSESPGPIPRDPALLSGEAVEQTVADRLDLCELPAIM